MSRAMIPAAPAPDAACPPVIIIDKALTYPAEAVPPATCLHIVTVSRSSLPSSTLPSGALTPGTLAGVAQQFDRPVLGSQPCLGLVAPEATGPTSFVLWENGNARVLPAQHDAWGWYTEVELQPKALRVYSSWQPFTAAIAAAESASFLPAGTGRASAMASLVVPGFGFLNGQWCDGWLAHINSAGQVTSLLAPGSSLRLKLPFPPLATAAAARLSPQAARALMPSASELARRCLVSAFQNLPQLGQGVFCITVTGFELRAALALVLLRQAFPMTRISLTAAEPFKDWPVAWRQLATALAMRSQPSSSGPLPTLPLTDLTAFIPASHISGLAATIHAMSQIFAGFPLPPSQEPPT